MPPRRPVVTQGSLCPVGTGVSGLLSTCVVGSGVLPVGGVPSSDLKPLMASELALKVIPAINAVKSQLASLTKTGGPVSILEAVVAELRAGQVELTRKVSDLTAKLAETRVVVKSLDNWVVAADFAQLSGLSTVVATALPLRTMMSGAPASVVLGPGSSSSAALKAVPYSATVIATMPELLSADIDRLLALDGGESLSY